MIADKEAKVQNRFATSWVVTEVLSMEMTFFLIWILNYCFFCTHCAMDMPLNRTHDIKLLAGLGINFTIYLLTLFHQCSSNCLSSYLPIVVVAY